MDNFEKARNTFKEKGWAWKEFNNGMHFRITLGQFGKDGHVDFWPTREKFIHGEHADQGLFKLIDYINNVVNFVPSPDGIKQCSVEELFEVARHVKEPSLFNLCKAIHQYIYSPKPTKGKKK